MPRRPRRSGSPMVIGHPGVYEIAHLGIDSYTQQPRSRIQISRSRISSPTASPSVCFRLRRSRWNGHRQRTASTSDSASVSISMRSSALLKVSCLRRRRQCRSAGMISAPGSTGRSAGAPTRISSTACGKDVRRRVGTCLGRSIIRATTRCCSTRTVRRRTPACWSHRSGPDHTEDLRGTSSGLLSTDMGGENAMARGATAFLEIRTERGRLLGQASIKKR